MHVCLFRITTQHWFPIQQASNNLAYHLNSLPYKCISDVSKLSIDINNSKDYPNTLPTASHIIATGSAYSCWNPFLCKSSIPRHQRRNPDQSILHSMLLPHCAGEDANTLLQDDCVCASIPPAPLQTSKSGHGDRNALLLVFCDQHENLKFLAYKKQKFASYFRTQTLNLKRFSCQQSCWLYYAWNLKK